MESVEGEGTVRYRLRVRGDQRLAVFELAKAEDWKLLELKETEATLESLFLEVTGSEERVA